MSEDDPNFLFKTFTLYPSKPKVPAWLIVEDDSLSESEDKSWLGTCSQASNSPKAEEERDPEEVAEICQIDFMELPFDQVDFIEERLACFGTTYVPPSQFSIFPEDAALVLLEEDH